MPIAKADLLAGYGLAFGVVAAAQAAIVSLVTFWLLGLQTPAPPGCVVALAVSNAVLGMALGLFVSAFARSEFQAVQFMPAVVFPQLLLCGLFVPAVSMAAAHAGGIADALPLTYAYDALARATSPRPRAAR